MTKKQNTIYGIIAFVVGIMGGIAGAAYAFGGEQRHIKDTLALHTAEIAANEASVQQEMDRYAEIMTAQMINLQDAIRGLTTTVYDLRTDVQVLKALMERVEIDIKKGS